MMTSIYIPPLTPLAQRSLATAIARPAHHPNVAAYIRVALVVLVAIAFSPAVHALFINFDDSSYLFVAGLQNPEFNPGLSLHNIRWVFTHPIMGLYHPVTALSLMVDYRLFGLNSAGYHAVNVLIHALSCILLFQFLCSATDSLWRSALAAAVFAVHPLRVESVLWVVERKDVLFVFFGLISLNIYVWYVRSPRVWKMLLCGLAFEFSLLSKPMLLTLPLVLLLLDYWPLNRFRFSPARPGEPFIRRSAARLVAEKTLLLAIVAGTVLLSMPRVFESVFKFPLDGESQFQAVTADKAPTMSQLFDYGLFESRQWQRMNIPIQYVRYLEKTVDFSHLAAFYPPVRWHAWQVAGATAILASIFLGVFFLRRKHPWLAVGWLWFFGTLVPVTFNQISYYSLADRYTYFPMIGLLIAVIWSIPAAWATTTIGRKWLAGGAAATLAWLSVSTYVQAGYWHNSQTLWRHAIQVTDDNWMAHYQLGRDLSLSKIPGDWPVALKEAQTAEAEAPACYYPSTLCGTMLLQLDRPDEALVEYRRSLLLNPQQVLIGQIVANLLYKKQQYAQSLAYARQAIHFAPDYADPHLTCAADLSKLGHTQDSIDECQTVIDQNPKNPVGYEQMGHTLEDAGNKPDADTYYLIARELEIRNGTTTRPATTQPEPELDWNAIFSQGHGKH